MIRLEFDEVNRLLRLVNAEIDADGGEPTSYDKKLLKKLKEVQSNHMKFFEVIKDALPRSKS